MCDYNKIKKLMYNKRNNQRNEMPVDRMGKNIGKSLFDEGLISKIYEEPIIQ